MRITNHSSMFLEAVILEWPLLQDQVQKKKNQSSNDTYDVKTEMALLM